MWGRVGKTRLMALMANRKTLPTVIYGVGIKIPTVKIPMIIIPT